MPWVRIDDALPDHPKLLKVGIDAAWMHICGLCYCSRFLTDGAVPDAVAGGLIRGKTRTSALRLVAKLIDAGLWRKTPDGYEINDFLEYNPSRSEVLERRAVSSRRSAMNGNPNLTKAIRARDRDECRYCGLIVNFRDRKGPGGGTYDHVHPMHLGGDDSLGNLVVACRACNSRKGARTPEQAGMKLRPSPDLGEIWPDSGQPQAPTPTPEDLDLCCEQTDVESVSNDPPARGHEEPSTTPLKAILDDLAARKAMGS